MSDEKRAGPVVANPWAALKRFTSARIALGRTGTSLPTGPHLEFQLAHARARNAVHHALNSGALADTLRQDGLEVIEIHSAAATRPVYLQRPDKGRMLDEVSRTALASLPAPAQPYDLAIVIGDGLSALAIEQNARPFLKALLPAIAAAGWRLAPVCIARQARVALGDEAGALLGARIVVVLIGERPGLSSPDSMGLYMTYGPQPGLTDEARNCISNVRPEGLSYERAAHKLSYLIGEAFKRQMSGVMLKDEADEIADGITGPAGRNFLTHGG